MLKSIECSLYCIDAVSGTERLRKNIPDTCCITYEADCTTSLDSCTRNSRAEKNGCALEIAYDLMRDCSSLERYCDNAVSSLLCSLPDSICNIVGFAETISDTAITVTLKWQSYSGTKTHTFKYRPRKD